MKEYLIGFFSCGALLLILGFSDQQGNRFKTETEINREFYEINRKLENPTFTIRSSTPGIGELENGEIVLVSTGAKSIFFRVENEIYRISGERWQ